MTNHAFENVHGLKDPTHLDWGNTVARSAECAGAVSQDTLHHQTPELRDRNYLLPYVRPRLCTPSAKV